ncbi:hypothetical protein KL953_00615 [Mycolicibacterium goodii]|nr:hypothetical protein [Mycolicibacterium goodii]OKH75203.1 hypothetical protein EB74_30880 [Mycobacterium sp. SWH-M5]
MRAEGIDGHAIAEFLHRRCDGGRGAPLMVVHGQVAGVGGRSRGVHQYQSTEFPRRLAVFDIDVLRRLVDLYRPMVEMYASTIKLPS